MRSLFRGLKAVSVFTLIFFSWTYLPLYQIAAYAAVSKHESEIIKSARKKQKPEERLEQLLDDLKEKARKAEEKAAKHKDATSDIEEIKIRETEIEALDADFRKEFAATEKKLKDANLPKEILDRHNAFVKNYEDNLAQLKANVNAVEKAKTPSALTTALAKTTKYLEKVRPPKKPFDPNKLPNRIVKAKERQPKLKKEEWEKELKKQSKKTRRAQRQAPKPIIVASNGPLTGLLSVDSFSASIPDENWQLASADMNGAILSAATLTYPYPEEMYPLPWQTDMTPEDMQETPETHITDAIRAKAAELGNNPVKMFNWLNNNIYLVPSYGSIQGADMCLQTKQCNETDIASLTIAMFRAAGWPARYEFVTAQLDINRFMENMGGFTDPMAAITFAASGGIPIRPVISGGKITSVQFERVYATALLPTGYYIGAVMKKGWSQPIWMPIDVSLKHYITTPGMDISTAVPFDVQSFVNQIQSTATINETEGYVTNVNSALVQQTMQDYRSRVQDYISQTTPTGTVGDVLGKREIKQINFPILSPTGWTKPIAGRIQSHTLPDSMRPTVSFTIQDSNAVDPSFSYTINVAELAGKRVTLSYLPATDADAQTLTTYGYYNVNPYLINLKPVLNIDGVSVITGRNVGMGTLQTLSLSFSMPDGTRDLISHEIAASTYASIGLDLERIPKELIDRSKARLDVALNQLGDQEVSVDDVVGEILNLHSLAYFYQVEAMNKLSVRGKVAYTKQPEEMLTTLSPNIGYLYGIPYRISGLGMKVDVRRYVMTVVSLTGNIDQEKTFMLMAGQNSSTMEHALFEEFSQGSQGVSALKIISEAMKQGIPIYEINSANIGAILPRLAITSEAAQNITNAVASGKKVYTPEKSIQYYDWTGDGYIIIDPATGAGAYMISGGLAGGGSAQSSNNPASVIGQLLMSISFSTLRESFRQIASATPNFSPAVNILRQWAGPLATLINSVFAGLNMWQQDTNNPWSGVAAGLGTWGIGMLAWAFLFYALPAAGFMGAFGIVLLIAMVAISVMLWQTILLDYIRSTATGHINYRQYYYAKRFVHVT